METHQIYTILLNVAVYAPMSAAVLMSVFFPFFGARSSKALSIAATAISFVSALVLWGAYMEYFAAETGFAFATSPVILGVTFPALALNGVSVTMFSLSAIVGFAATLWGANTDIPKTRFYFILLMMMQGGLMGAFATTNILWMYIFHEFALVPTFIAMSIWGGAGRRMAAMEMAIYLTAGALVSLIGLIALYSQVNSESFALADIVTAIMSNPLSDNWQNIIFGLLLMGLGTLVSLFPFYSWAPRAYAAAPTSFAMLHSGVLKKFGLYVLIQVAIPFLPSGCAAWAWGLAILALFNVIYIGLVTMTQRDLKLMVAYSSVSHMGLCFLGLASMSVLGVGGAIILMFGHGLSVALMFMLSNAIVNRTGEWDMFNMGGLYKQTPNLAGFFIVATMAGVGLPCFANFWGELGVLIALWNFSPVICALGAVGLVISAIYGLRAVARIFMGKPSASLEKRISRISDLSFAEKIPAIILTLALLFVGFCPKAITTCVDACLSNISAYNQSK